MKGPLDGKVAIITGGSRGIGAEVGARLAEDGAAVVVSGRDGERLQRTVREWETQGRAVLGVVADAASREDCERLVSTAKQHFGRIDVLVNNAGVTHDQLLVQQKLASLGALTAGIAHEIKNPLNFVTNFAEVSISLVTELSERALCDRTRRTEIRGGVHAPGGAGDKATLAALPENRTRSTGNPGG